MEQTAKQQVAERLRQAANVLVTVSKDPSVDQLAAAVGLTLMLNKLGKHATCVFSGKIPDTMEFLQPEKTIEATVDSLRDFIISLDKEKADKLRYKIDGDVVKIFVTPYRTKITKDDIRFEQGDFNVDVVVALGVADRNDIDAAIAAHGRILHDATVVGVNFGDKTSSVGSIDWHEPTAGSLSEMLVSISESLEGNIIDAQMATAFLTGIVAATNRFSNERTSPKVMTMSAQLMAAGANQQLIAQNLGADGSLGAAAPAKTDSTELHINEEGAPTEGSATVDHAEPAEEPAPAEPAAELPAPVEEPAQAEPTPPPAQETASEPTPPPQPPEEPAVVNTPKSPFISDTHGVGPKQEADASNNPVLGGTFNATSAAAQEEADRKKEALNNEILAHPVQPPTEAGVDEARAAVENAIQGADFYPDNNPLQASGSDGTVLVQPPVAPAAPSTPPAFTPPPDITSPPVPPVPQPEPFSVPNMPPPFPPPGLGSVPPAAAPVPQPPAPAPETFTPPTPPAFTPPAPEPHNAQPVNSDFVIPNVPPPPPQQ